MAYLEINDVCKGFGSGTARFEVLKNINLHVKEGEFIAILGYSGVGKSTLMNLIAGLEEPDSGEIIVNDKKNNLDVIGIVDDEDFYFINVLLFVVFITKSLHLYTSQTLDILLLTLLLFDILSNTSYKRIEIYSI